MATWLPMVPEQTMRAASLLVISAIMASRELVVGSEPPSITSSRRVVLAIAESMRAVGVVTMSPIGLKIRFGGVQYRVTSMHDILRKSKAAGPGWDQLLTLAWPLDW